MGHPDFTKPNFSFPIKSLLFEILKIVIWLKTEEGTDLIRIPPQNFFLWKDVEVTFYPAATRGSCEPNSPWCIVVLWSMPPLQEIWEYSGLPPLLTFLYYTILCSIQRVLYIVKICMQILLYESCTLFALFHASNRIPYKVNF